MSRGNPGARSRQELRPRPTKLTAIGPRRPRPFPGRGGGHGLGELLGARCPRPYSAAWHSPRHGSSASALCLLGLLVDRHLGLRVQREGTSETDTTCTCHEGLHCTSEACESCTAHSLCPPGLGVKQIVPLRAGQVVHCDDECRLLLPATEVSDTICDPCPVGFFSNVSSALEKCHPWTSCETKGLMEIQEGTNKTDVVCGPPPRMRALVVIPITMGILLAVLLVSACVSESPGKVAKEPENKVMWKDHREDPVEDVEEFPVPLHSIAPVQETLHGCQPVTQEDGKESRISVQERV
ncbi:tumor necrosis factor receptor superfamily member 5 isoform X3 [Lutra lutra]|uniref:tumor necrosis factor receptor superfamily member 5 isoform X3 n=1 Tax=Lutra lutra TaxID=9657 RepID=UPI001FD24AA9|nr:tumor necrosis factor receptor superfamily member 5 isoform X3 [Lutra lutra]